MKTSNPQTVSDWANYISTLSGEGLRSKAIVANSFRFVQMLQDEGYSAQEINKILKRFARQFIYTKQEPPSDGYINYKEIQ